MSKDKFDSDDFRYNGEREYKTERVATKIKDLYDDTEDYETQITSLRAELDALQSMMYAHNRYGLLVIFQALDAAGKDSTIKHVMAGVNPAGVRVAAFKQPTEAEISHDFLWRNTLQMPERGSITIFNRSYYEEVLVVKIHPNILLEGQEIPAELTKDLDKVWQQRYEDIANYEKYLVRNGIRIVKFFLNISKHEQAERLIARIEDPTKNWKFQEGDVQEREYWNQYHTAYEEAINQTATKKAPWYVIPADDKKNMRLIVSKILLEEMQSMNIFYPESDPARQALLKKLVGVIKKQNEE